LLSKFDELSEKYHSVLKTAQTSSDKIKSSEKSATHHSSPFVTGQEVKRRGEEQNEWEIKRKEIAAGKKKVFENKPGPRSSSILYSKTKTKPVHVNSVSSSSVLSPKLKNSVTSF
ncbi:hypothetical protein, partial [Escherichia coli]|uniref:hypothetical protein n=1 Tax=Escherichia coli TaxID=562 RepID=UPI00178C5539